MEQKWNKSVSGQTDETVYKDPRLPHFGPIKSVSKAKKEHQRAFSFPRECETLESNRHDYQDVIIKDSNWENFLTLIHVHFFEAEI